MIDSVVAELVHLAKATGAACCDLSVRVDGEVLLTGYDGHGFLVWEVRAHVDGVEATGLPLPRHALDQAFKGAPR